MPLPPSGPLSMSQINLELAVPATTLISLNQTSARALAGVPAGMISISDFYGKPSGVNGGIVFGGFSYPTPAQTVNYSVNSFAFDTETMATLTSNPAGWNYGSVFNDADKATTFGGATYTSPAAAPLTTMVSYPFSTGTRSVGITIPFVPTIAGGIAYTTIQGGDCQFNFSDVGYAPAALNQIIPAASPTTIGNGINKYIKSTQTLSSFVATFGQYVPATTSAFATRSGINNSTEGIWANQRRQTPGQEVNAVWKFIKSTETQTYHGALMVRARAGYNSAGTPTHGYFIGGFPLGTPTAGSKIAYSTMTATSFAFSVIGRSQSVKNSTSAYFIGGMTSTIAATNSAQKLVFSTDTITTLNYPAITPRGWGSGSQPSNIAL